MSTKGKPRKDKPGPPPLEVMLFDLWDALNDDFKSEPFGTKPRALPDERPIMAVMISDLWGALKPESKSPPFGTKAKPS